ncbi:prolipoprotein diacylglyceryl transferase [Roseomonas alkaliterrae]|uniref:Phosphatidylglycerol--prolipoprotein diacylglyceryl transferase n=1 Tax=Neoroseomonas alkaliterrae TaxID=1452450 RepID=A0A840Y3E4_9PROT|nr:prolipoprotein diacylglyceryl transferase [Neoroseomonas alkaliterrae]MBB5688394.1 phosphatidylglycerol:prolipoprotein diacylglycerol transferase [Neoroseomonas alkaliterrae]MBR0677545.1 prolipoprotein diacylglyceryl transferase [Neoroseomonas alkaliterrae]
MLPVIAFPVIDPVLVEIGPFAIRWYALAYIAGIVIGWRLARRLVQWAPKVATPEQMDDYVTWVTLGIIAGGRLGYVLFYRPGYYVTAPWEALYLWHGGMSFHGGALGVIIATWLFGRRNRLDWVAFADRVVCVVPIGLFFGRIANFINGELWGRVTDVPWAMVFPTGGPEPRHPSQLYQAFFEGLCLFALLMWLARSERIRARPGVLSGAFLAGYGVARSIGEVFRQPDAHLGFLVAGATMGQLLSVPMILAGAWLILRAKERHG